MIIRLCLLIFISFLLIEIVHSATKYHIRSYLKGTANKPKLSKLQVREFLQNEVSSTLKHSAFVVSNLTLHRLASRRPQHVEFDVTINGDVTPETIILFRSMEKIQAMGVKQIDNVEPAVFLTTQDSPYCLNGGFQLEDGSCVCPEEFLGDQCQYLFCFNNGVYDVEFPWQCNCPPGFNDYQCLNRNCRPAIQDDVNPPARTLVVVIPAIVSFQANKNVILNNLVQTVANLQAQEPGWIGYYFAVMFASQNEGLQYEFLQSANLTDFINQVSNFGTFDDQLNPITDDQNIIAGVELAYYRPYNGYPIGNSLILAFSDTANYYDQYSDYTGVTYPLELVLSWRSKVFFFIIDDVSVGNRTIDVTSDGFDNLRYFSKHIHAPIFHFNETEIPQIMNSVVSKLYRPQYIDVRLLTGASSTRMNVMADYYYSNNSTVKFMVTIDSKPGEQGSLNVFTDGLITKPISSGKYWQMYEVPSSAEYVVCAKDTENSTFTYSVFQWTSSQDYFLWGMHETSNVDIGGVYTIPEKHMHIGVGGVSSNIPYYMYYLAMDSSSGSQVGSWGLVENRDGCTLDWEFMRLSQCSTGPYVHQFLGLSSSGSFQRVYPAYCKHALAIQDPVSSARLKGMSIAQSSGRKLSKEREVLAGVCPTKGVTAFADPRYQPVRQYIFAVEWADNNYVFLNDLRDHINDWINSIYNSLNQQMFTLIIFDQDSFKAKTIMTEHYKEHFLRRINDLTIQKVEDILHENFNGTETYSDSLYAVIMANVQTLLPKAIVHVMTQSPVSFIYPGSWLILPKSIEVNYFYLADDSASYPFSVVTRQTNGRWFNAQYASNMVKNFAEESQSMDLVFDEMYQLPDETGVTVPLLVEARATILEILVTGVYSKFELSHPKTNLTVLETSMSNYAYKVVYDVSHIKDNSMNMNIYCSYCTVQARVATPLKLYYGFTSNSFEDVNVQYEPAAWVRSNGTQFAPTYVVGHVSGLLANETVKSLAISLSQGSMSNSVFTANKAYSVIVNMRARTACGYQYVGSVDPYFLQQIQYDGLKFTSTMVTSFGNIYRRIVYYYVPKDLKTTDTCNGAPVNMYGECVCGDNWTGEYCQIPVCQNYGYSNFGACTCADNYAGKFCETEITENVSDPPPTTTTIQTTKTMSVTSTTPITTQSTTTQPPPPPCSSPIPVTTVPPQNNTTSNNITTTVPPPGDNGNKRVALPGEILLLTVFTLLWNNV